MDERGVHNDAALLRASGEGDRRAYAELYRRYAPWLVARLAQRCEDSSLLDDVVQEVFLALWTGTAKGEDVRDVPAWLWRIGQRRVVDMQRAQNVRRRLWGTLTRRRVEAARSAEDQVVTDIEHGDLAAALSRLTIEQRAVVRANAVHGLTMQEIATLLDIPVGTVKTRFARARRRLREELA